MQKTLFGLLCLLFTCSPVLAEESTTGKADFKKEQRGFSGPGSTSKQLAEDDEIKSPALILESFDKALEPWFNWKSQLNTNVGLQLGVAYTSLFQSASDVPNGAEDTASSGIFRVSGRWNLLNAESGNTGNMVFSVDHRHAYGAIAPADLGFAAGYLGIPGTLFNDTKTLLGDLNWQYSFNDGQSGLVMGRYDPNDFLDVLGYANPWTSFQNLAILFNASIALPDWGTGIGVGHWFNDQWYGLASISDANGVATETKLFHDTGELYKTAEFGWSPSRGERYFTNIHVTIWDADERVDAGVPQSDGFTLSANWTFNQKLMLFTKYGSSNGAAPLYNKSFTAGLIYYITKRTDLFGLAMNWGEPVGSNKDQVTTEMFYRLQLAQNLAITPSVQLVSDPAANPDEDEILFAGVRVRFSF